MSQRLVVYTECPCCGAPLDFSEGSNSIRCRHCRSNLLVTGRGQVLSYAVSPRLDRHGAMVRASQAHREKGLSCRILKTRLYFIPYFRLTGQDFRLRSGSSERTGERSPISKGRKADFFDRYFGDPRFGGFGAVSGDAGPGAVSVRHRHREQGGDIHFQDRYVEKNFLARPMPGLNLYSLGVRPSVVRLELYRKEGLARQGKIVAAEMTPDQAMAQAMKAEGGHDIRHRAVLGRVLSLIYFPFWVIEVKRQRETRLCLVDAVARNLVQLDAPLSAYRHLDQVSDATLEVIGFRPLTCPNCGWDFPVRPEDVIFFCSACHRAWQINASRLDEIAYEIADVKPQWRGGRVQYLPFWIFRTRLPGREDPFRIFSPAFRYRRLKYLGNLARNLSRRQPTYSVDPGSYPELHGCYYGREDALSLARFTMANLSMNGMPKLKKLSVKDPLLEGDRLAWIAFRVGPHSLIDPFLGMGLPKTLLQ